MQDKKQQKNIGGNNQSQKQAFQKIKNFHGQTFFVEILIKNNFFVNENNSFFESYLRQSKHKVAKCCSVL